MLAIRKWLSGRNTAASARRVIAPPAARATEAVRHYASCPPSAALPVTTFGSPYMGLVGAAVCGLPFAPAPARRRNQRRIGPGDQVLDRTWRHLVDRDIAPHCRERYVDHREVGQLKSFSANSAEEPACDVVHGMVDLVLEAD